MELKDYTTEELRAELKRRTYALKLSNDNMGDIIRVIERKTLVPSESNGEIIMKATDFIDEWNKIHTSSPSFQDVLDWAERKQAEEMKELNKEWRVTLALQRQVIIKKAHKWLKENIDGGVHPSSTYGFVEKFRKAMEE